MGNLDFSPLYRSTVGFDRLFDMLDRTPDAASNWPPYNVEKSGDDRYRIIMAVAGYSPGEIELVQQENTLTVSGHKPEPGGDIQYLYRGIATRNFKLTFSLADYVKIVGANLENGLLTIDLVREVPEAMKPRRIPIAISDGQKTIEHSQAA
ncbi:Hsp20 family protein [Microvirga rosea]|uniref:Hsp20 family protein n=1 Tax=Microvirga rosea TaxID=2715425 RepID=UPI001D0B93AA|nr:Hsp20 family protein [Microvirga rosea]MCB8819817.1 Hsp20 family protein [Microvirga rosea]